MKIFSDSSRSRSTTLVAIAALGTIPVLQVADLISKTPWNKNSSRAALSRLVREVYVQLLASSMYKSLDHMSIQGRRLTIGGGGGWNRPAILWQ